MPERLVETDMVYVGDIYTVDHIIYRDNLQFYTLAERNRFFDRVQYLSTRFVPLTETEDEEESEEIKNVETQSCGI